MKKVNLLSSAKDWLNSPGAIGILPTDTVYGVIARAADKPAVERLYSLKHRHQKSGTIIAATVEQLVELGIKRRYLKAVEQFWPGAVSVIIPCGQELAYLHMGKAGLAVRIPSDQALASLLSQTGPLLTRKANLPGELPVNTIKEARAYFGNEVDFYIDGSNLAGRSPSTIIRIIDDAIEVLRPGAVVLQTV